jgi:arylformamidase
MALRRETITRRSAIAGIAGGAAATLAGAYPSQALGQSVWLDMDQDALNDAYSQGKNAPNIAQVVARYGTNSQLARRHLGEPQKFAYGPGDVETLDMYRADEPNAPIHIFMHGGAWQQGKAEGYAFPAELFVNAGAHFVVPDFSWVQDVDDSLYPIVDELRRAVTWIYRNAGQFGGDPGKIFLSGHSSGAHLAGVLLTTDWEARGLPSDIIKGGMCCSGMFDLKPVRLSHRGEYIAFTDQMEHDLSPIRHLDQLNAPVIVAYGSYETREFKRQSEEFASAIKAAGKPVELIVARNYNHFEVIETLANPHGILGSAVLAQMS